MTDVNALLDGFAARLSVVEKSLGLAGGAGGSAAPAAAAAEEESPKVVAYDAFSKEHLDTLAAACKAIGGADMAAINDLVAGAWAAQRAFLVTASQCKKPADKLAVMKASGVVDACGAANKAIKRGDFELHYKMVAEGLGSLNWLMIEPKPREIIENQIGSADFHGNKIRLQFKRNTDAFNADQHAVCDSFKKLLSGLMPFIKEHHMAGVEWNPRGGDAMAFKAPAAAAAAAPAAKTPPAAAAGGGARPAMSMGDLKAEMEAKKDNAAAGLKKVTKDMQTWRADFKASDAPPPPKPKIAPRPVVIKTKGDHKVAFMAQGRRWCVEAQTKDDGVVEVKCDDVKHSVAVYGCFQATINITGKCKGVTIDSCEQTKVLIDSTISAVELVNCKRMQIQIRETAPTVAIDKTDGCQVYLSAEGRDITTFTTAKSSEMNVSFPDPRSADGELMETPIPEQFVHKVILTGDGGPHMSAEVSELYTH